MSRKPSTSSVGDGNRALAMKGLKDRQKKGSIPQDDTVLSIADHGNVIVVYTEHTSFGMTKDKDKEDTDVKSSSTG